MLITDQVATAPCTDPVQEWCRTVEAKATRQINRRAYCGDFDISVSAGLSQRSNQLMSRLQ